VFVNVVSWVNRSQIKYIKRIFTHYLLPHPFLPFQIYILAFIMVYFSLLLFTREEKLGCTRRQWNWCEGAGKCSEQKAEKH